MRQGLQQPQLPFNIIPEITVRKVRIERKEEKQLMVPDDTFHESDVNLQRKRILYMSY
jgi:hypothetical protein